MEANSKKDVVNESGFPRFDNEQKEEVVEIIGDILNEEREKDENLHNAELYNASVEIATLLSGSAVFFSVAFETWRVTHTKTVREIKKRAEYNGLSLREEDIDEIINKVAEFRGYKYPPLEGE